MLARAAERLGGVEALAVRLKVSQRLLAHYLEGKDPVPDSLMLSAIDVVLDDAPKGGTSEPLIVHRQKPDPSD